MKKLALLLSILIANIITVAQTIIVPDNYPEIQQAIEASETGDTVLVKPGIYYEPINYNGKNLVVTSLYLFTRDTSDISQTIIDGNNENMMVIFESNEDSTALLCGFTIQNGYSSYRGGGIYCRNSSPTLSDLNIKDCSARSTWDGVGGGIYCSNSSLTLKNTTIKDCDSYFGGGVYLFDCSPVFIDVNIFDNIASAYLKSCGPDEGVGGGINSVGNTCATFENVKVTGNTADMGGGIHWGSDTISFFSNVTIKNNTALESGGGIHMHDVPPVFDEVNRCNIHSNSSHIGNDISWEGSEQSLHLILDTFSVLYPTEYYINDIKNLSYDIKFGLIELVDVDLYVSPEGKNENSGLVETEPLKTIDHAFSKIRADNTSHHTIHLMDGVYSDSVSGEKFPINVIDHVTLKGNSTGSVILDAEGVKQVMTVNRNDSTLISGIKITQGAGYPGGGISCLNSSLYLTNMLIEENVAYGGYWSDEPSTGGGLYMESSYVVLKNSTLNNNTALNGAGIYLVNTIASFDNIIVTENTNVYEYKYETSPPFYSACGGGIFSDNSVLELKNSTIQKNETHGFEGYYSDYAYGGGLFFEESKVSLISVLISGNLSDFGGGVYFSENTTGKFENVNIMVNNAEKGGAIYWDNNLSFVFDETNRCNIYGNRALHGNDLFANKAMHVVVDTFSVLYPTEYFADPHENFTFDILNGKIEQVNADLYVSPDGNNNNDGLNEESPLQTIHQAISKMQADWYNTHEIHLLPGTYNVSETNEFFPINLPEFISLTGAGDSTTIIDAEYKSEVILIDHNNYNNKISNLTIAGGDTLYENDRPIGTAINCINSSPELTNLKITANGGYAAIVITDYSNPTLKKVDIVNNLTSGIYCSDFSEPHLEDVNISGNQFKNQNWWGRNHGVGMSCVNQSNAYIENVSIQNNITNGGNSNGGGFYCNNSSPSLRNVIITDNQSNIGGGLYITDNSSPFLVSVIINNNDGGSRGGGLYVSNSDPVFNEVKVNNNTANYGGGIYFDGDCDHDVFSTLEISQNHAGSGGGIFVSGENMSLENMMIVENEATYSGGGIQMYGGAHFLSDLTIKNNTAEYGGGIDFNDYRVFFDSYERCNIYFNKAAYGDDLHADNLVVPINIIADTFTVLYPNDYHAYQSENFTFNILHGLIEQVDADLYLSPNGDNENSGLSSEEPLKNMDYALSKILVREDNPHTIYLMEGTYSPSLTGEEFPITLIDHLNLVGTSRDNVILNAESKPNSATIILTNNISNTISDLTITGSVGYDGAIQCRNSNPTLERLNVINNISNGMQFYSSTPVIRDVKVANNSEYGLWFYDVDDGIVENCTIEENGRTGIDISNSKLHLTNLSVIKNEGTGIYSSDSEIILDNVQIEENTGRGLACRYSDMALTNATIYNNTDGGLFTSYSDAVLNKVRFENNSSNKGGGMYVHVSNMEADSLNIINNTSRLGGGIFDYHSDLKLTNSIITGNEASEEGGGVYGAKATTNIINTLIAYNTAPRGGGVYSILYNEMSLINSTIVSNTADNGGGLAGWYYAHPKITNSILWNNTEPNIFFDGRVESYLDISYSDIQGGQEAIVTNDAAVVNWLEGNLDEDPLFIDTGEFDFALSDESPCINAGNPDTLGLNLPEIDLLGNPRIWNNRIDIGVIEWNSLGIFNQDGSESEYMLSCSPNPFATSTIVEYELEKSGYVQLSIYNHMGDLVEVLVQKHQPQGKHQVNWESLNLPAGIYHCILKTESKTGSFKLIKL